MRSLSLAIFCLAAIGLTRCGSSQTPPPGAHPHGLVADLAAASRDAAPPDATPHKP